MGFWVGTFLKTAKTHRNSSNKLYQQCMEWWHHLANLSDFLASFGGDSVEEGRKFRGKNAKKFVHKLNKQQTVLPGECS